MPASRAQKAWDDIVTVRTGSLDIKGAKKWAFRTQNGKCNRCEGELCQIDEDNMKAAEADGKLLFQLDHKVALQFGGCHRCPGNHQALCSRCHSWKCFHEMNARTAADQKGTSNVTAIITSLTSWQCFTTFCHTSPGCPIRPPAHTHTAIARVTYVASIMASTINNNSLFNNNS